MAYVLDQEATVFTIDDVKELKKRREDEALRLRRQQGIKEIFKHNFKEYFGRFLAALTDTIIILEAAHQAYFLVTRPSRL